jgi:uncharacterized protein YkwD
MLQSRYKYMSVSALAFAALAFPASAVSTCELADGLPLDPVAYNQEVAACYSSPTSIAKDAKLEKALVQATDAVRAADNEPALIPLASLEEAARIHAMDMAARNYAGHTDKEGRGHLERVRMLDRSVLIGAAGANIAILEGEGDAEAVFNALRADPVNASNMTRDAFTHTGIGIAKANGRTYIVQLFARVDGHLESPLPIQVSGPADIKATFDEKGVQPVGWRLTTPEGETVARGYGANMTGTLAPGQQAYVTFDMARSTQEYALRGPLVVGR